MAVIAFFDKNDRVLLEACLVESQQLTERKGETEEIILLFKEFLNLF